MKTFLKSIASQLNNYTLSLDKKSILIDKPWAMIDQEFDMQKLIFKSNKELILSKNGQVSEGKWDYFPEAKSLLIDRGTDKILCNVEFVVEAIMILKLDGTLDKFFVLANENLVPDLNAERYLRHIRNEALNILEVELEDGQFLTVNKDFSHVGLHIGDKVSSEQGEIDDGYYRTKDSNKTLAIEKAKVKLILHEVKYLTPYGLEVTINQQYYHGYPQVGDFVFINGKRPKETIVIFSKSQNLILEDGRIVQIKITRNWFQRSFIDSYADEARRLDDIK